MNPPPPPPGFEAMHQAFQNLKPVSAVEEKKKVEYGEIQVSPVKNGPNAAIKVRWRLSREIGKQRALEIGLFRKACYYNDRPIISRKFEPHRKEGVMNFRAPRTPGEYQFRLVDCTEELECFIRSNDFSVTIQAKDIPESIRFILRRVEDPSSSSSGFLQFARLVDQIETLQLDDSPKERFQVVERINTLTNCLITCCQLVVPPTTTTTQVELHDTKYDKDAHSALHTLLLSFERNDVVLKAIPESIRGLIEMFQVKLYCPVAELYFTPIQGSTLRMRSMYWRETFHFDLWQCKPTQLPLPALKHLSEALQHRALAWIPNEQEFLAPRIRLRQKLMQLVGQLRTGADLQVFGSSQNNFGSLNSDMDMCLMCLDPDTDSLEQLKALVELLQDQYSNIDTDRLTARVPIVMFHDEETGLECDICVNNTLALRNTALLRAYSMCDPRIRPLAFLIKKWTKERRINTPSEGTLSSYGYLLLLIAYLQQIEPPILPVLQSLHPHWNGSAELVPRIARNDQMQLPTVPCAGKLQDNSKFETYFYDPVNNPRLIQQLVAFGARNNASLADLLLGFWHYYATQVDFSTHVVTIRQAPMVLLSEKMKQCPEWRKSRRISIEDPFEVSYDVAHVLKESCFKYIRKEFARAYSLAEQAIRQHESFELVLDQIYTPVHDDVPFIKT